MVHINGDFKFPTSKKDTIVFKAPADTNKIVIPLVQLSDEDKGELQNRIQSMRVRLEELRKQREAIQLPELPPAPKPDKPIVITIKPGDTASQLAEKYHCSMEELQKANPDLSLGGLVAGKKLNMPTVSQEKWAPYAKSLDERNRINQERIELDRQILDLQNELSIAQNTVRAQEIIGEIQAGKRADHFNERYEMSVNSKNGNLCLKLKKELPMSKIKHDFRLADGVIRETNKDASGETILKEFDERFFYTNYDDKIAPVGQILQLPPFECTPRTR